MTRARVAAVGGNESFPTLVARVLGASVDDIVIIPSVASAERAIAEGGALFDVVVLAPSVGEDDAASIAAFMSKEVPTTAVVVVRDSPVDGAFPRLVRSGVRDVVDLTRGGGEFKEALDRAVEWAAGVRGTAAARAGAAEASLGAIISIFSTKGGTGKTFLSCNLAAALADRTGRSVGLLDLDHDLGDVFAYFGATPRRSLQEMLILDEDGGAGQVEQLGTPLLEGVIGFGSASDPRAEPLPSGAITRMLRALKEAFAFTVVDATSEYSDHVLATFDLSDAICLITGLDAIGVRHMSIGMQTLKKLGVPPERLKFVLNRADSKVDLTPQDVERLLSIRVNAKIPSSSLVPRSMNRARLLWQEERRSNVAKAIEGFADQLRTEFAPTVAAPSAPSARRRRKNRG
jgi:pilus assembly protein CpaE